MSVQKILFKIRVVIGIDSLYFRAKVLLFFGISKLLFKNIKEIFKKLISDFFFSKRSKRISLLSLAQRKKQRNIHLSQALPYMEGM